MVSSEVDSVQGRSEIKELFECFFFLAVVLVLGVSMVSVTDNLNQIKTRMDTIETELHVLEKETKDVKISLECTNTICQKIMTKEW